MNEVELNDDEFLLYDLRLEVEAIEGNCTCNMAVGDSVDVIGGKFSLPRNSDFCLYALQAAIPMLPAKQRNCDPADWMETDTRVVCPDPGCRLTMRIDRIAKRKLKHDDVSPVPWDEVDH